MADTPDDLLGAALSRLHLASTALFRIDANKAQIEGTKHIGAGTFVSVGNHYGVLTVTHVSDEVAPGSHLGLVIAREGQVHRFEIPRSTLKVTSVASRRTDEYGPDLSFISLTDWEGVGTIRASRYFHSLDQDRDDLINTPPDIEDGIWFACGTPEERIRFEEDSFGFDRVMSIEVYCGIGGVDPPSERNGFDYIEFPVIDDGPTISTSFKGMSGGGLWQVTIKRSKSGDLETSRFLLMGTIFFQGVRENGIRFLRCHGPLSLYKRLIEKLIV